VSVFCELVLEVGGREDRKAEQEHSLLFILRAAKEKDIAIQVLHIKYPQTVVAFDTAIVIGHWFYAKRL